jgi:hypothetical protein
MALQTDLTQPQVINEAFLLEHTQPLLNFHETSFKKKYFNLRGQS